MKRLASFLAFFTVAVAMAAMPEGLRAQGDETDPNFWRKTFGLADSNDPLVSRAHQIFERLRGVVDERGRRLPRLLVVAGPPQPAAQALPDGTIVINSEMIELCYSVEHAKKLDASRLRAITEEPGDARLAHVLGHELAHLSQDDFQHEEQYFLARSLAFGGGRDAILESSGRFRESFPERELVADRLGLQYLLMADFQAAPLFVPKPLVQVIQERAGELGAVVDPSGRRHPAAQARMEALRVELQHLSRSFELFHWGTRLLELGNYEDSILLLERYREVLPSREVLNNLGLAHYQLAARALAACDGRLVVRYRLPLVVDPRTVEDRSRLRGSESSCFESPLFRQPMDEAQRNLEAARTTSPSHVTARLNLVAAYLLDRNRASHAVAVAQEAAERAPDDPLVRVALETTHYVFLGVEFHDEKAADAALEALAAIAAGPAAPSPEALYNKAAIETARGRSAAAAQSLERFLQVEPLGPWADSARERLGLPAPAAPVAAEQPRPPPPPIVVGALTDAVRRQLADLVFESYRRGDLDLALYHGENVRVLRIDDAIEAVEHVMRGEGIELPFGTPLAVVRTTSGEIRRYPTFALDVRSGKVRSVIHYVARPIDSERREVL